MVNKTFFIPHAADLRLPIQNIKYVAISAVDGVDIRHSSHELAVKTIKNAADRMTLCVQSLNTGVSNLMLFWWSTNLFSISLECWAKSNRFHEEKIAATCHSSENANSWNNTGKKEVANIWLTLRVCSQSTKLLRYEDTSTSW